jgi:hypothetical protein
MHNPAAPHVLPWSAAVAKDVRVGTTGFFQSVRQDGQVLEAAVIVDGLGNVGRGAVVPLQPGGVKPDWAEGVVEEVVEQITSRAASRKRENPSRTAPTPTA